MLRIGNAVLCLVCAVTLTVGCAADELDALLDDEVEESGQDKDPTEPKMPPPPLCISIDGNACRTEGAYRPCTLVPGSEPGGCICEGLVWKCDGVVH